jgi:hypothetical protein
MWLMTKHGYFSVVEYRPGEFHVRSRERQDIENLVARVPLPTAKIVETPEADYAVRLVVDRDTVRKIMVFLAETLDYSNFKGQIARTPDQRHKPYPAIHDLLVETLGGYGRKPFRRNTAN